MGVEQGPSVLRGIVFGRSRGRWHDCGDIPCPSLDTLAAEDGPTPFLDSIVSVCSELRDRVEESYSRGHFPFVAGGDHVLAWGSIAAFVRRFGTQSPKCVYIDAHGDFNSPSESPSHNMHGMHLNFLTGMEIFPEAERLQEGKYLSPQDVYFIGTRSLDAYERRKAAELRLRISRLFPAELASEAPAHISFDIDVFDPSVAPGTSVPERDGLRLDEGLASLRAAMTRMNVVSFDFVELNPLLDRDGITAGLASAVIDLLDDLI